jgi:hypothetical protein
LVGAKREGREERDDDGDDDDDDDGAGDLKSQLFIYMTQPRSCGPQADPHSQRSRLLRTL